MATEQKIISKSLSIFNKKGVMAISMRDLAKACNMSLSNLQYHFKTKEKIMECIFDEMCMVFDNTADFKTKGLSITLLKDMNTLWYDFQRRFKFFFSEISLILQLHPSIRKKFIAIKNKRIREYNLLFQAYACAGIFHQEPYPTFFFRQSELLWFTANFYLSSQLGEGKKYSEKLREETNILFVNFIYSLLTPKGIKELNELK